MRIELGKHDNRAYVESRTDGAPGVTLTFEAEACETFDDRDIVRKLSPAEATQLARALTTVIVGGDRPFAPANTDEADLVTCYHHPECSCILDDDEPFDDTPPPDPGLPEKYARRRFGFGRVLELCTPPAPPPRVLDDVRLVSFGPTFNPLPGLEILPNLNRPHWWQRRRRRLYDECARNYAAATAARCAPTRLD